MTLLKTSEISLSKRLITYLEINHSPSPDVDGGVCAQSKNMPTNHTFIVVNRFVNYIYRRKMNKRLTFRTKVLRRSECVGDE